MTEAVAASVESLKTSTTLSVITLTRLVAQTLEAARMEPESAFRAAELLVYAQASGLDTHGVTHLPSYVRRLLDGTINPRPMLQFENTQGAATVLDAHDALGCIAADAAMREAMTRAATFGVGCVAVRNSSHFGPAGVYVQAAASAGYVALALSNASATIAPWGARESILGTNPIATAFPRANAEPVVVDMATSAAARADVRKAAAQGAAIPAHWALDSTGRPTTDAQLALQGSMQPLGGHKGFALALMVEMLCSCLAGGAPGFEVRVPQDTAPESCKVSHFFLTLEPGAFAGTDELRLGVETLANTIENSVPRDPNEPVRVPGSASAAARARSDAQGIKLSDVLLQALRESAALVHTANG